MAHSVYRNLRFVIKITGPMSKHVLIIVKHKRYCKRLVTSDSANTNVYHARVIKESDEIMGYNTLQVSEH